MESTEKKVSVMIVANKIDLRDQTRAEGKRVIEHIDGARLAKVCCLTKIQLTHLIKFIS
jgi:hypothetical protein